MLASRAHDVYLKPVSGWSVGFPAFDYLKYMISYAFHPLPAPVEGGTPLALPRCGVMR